MNDKIRKFLKDALTMTYCAVADNNLHCAICYFNFYEDESEIPFLLFKSAEHTKHIQYALKQPEVAGSILPNKKLTLATNRGIQFNGTFVLDENQLKQLKRKYYQKFPEAKVIPGAVWGIQLTSIKMTDNTLGFGKKITWPDTN